MIARSFSKIATWACAAIICIGFVSCSGAVSRPAKTAGQQPSQPPAGEPPAGAQLSLSAATSDSRPSAGAQFTLSITVRNDGEGTLPAVTLRYYRSTDATITTADTEVGTGAVAELAASGSASDSVELTGPSTPGTYYYGACVDTVTDETDTTNNCSTSVQVAVPEPERPDLKVAAPTVSDSGPVTGTQFTLSVTVRNDGNGTAAATTLRYYRSTDAAITTADTEVGTEEIAGLAARESASDSVERAASAPPSTEVGTEEIAGLAARGSASDSVELAAPATPGTYYYGACVDAVTDETDTTNNCSPSAQITVRITVTEPQGDPDLAVTSASVSDSGPASGAQFTLSATVRNDGEGAAAATTLRYYRSSDTTITTSDTQVGMDAITQLAAAGSSSQSVDLTASATSGTYYYGACVDTVTDETDTTNNCSTSVQVAVPEPERPDLKVAAPTVSDSDPAAGAQFTLSATVRNDGNGAAAATTLRYYRSANATITTSDTQVGMDAVAELAASGSGSESVGLTAPATHGTYYYGACVDTVADETDTSNNCSASVRMAVPEPERPDLKVAALSVRDSDPAAGAQFTLSATVRNDGNGAAAATRLRYYRSTDATITTSDTQVGTDAVAGLAASGSGRESVGLTAPASAGTYYYGACVDTVADESDTTNNCSTSVQVNVLAAEPEMQAQPDLVVAAPTVRDSNPAAGAQFTLWATVRNDGNGAAAATTLRYYRSTDATITTSDTSVGTDAIAQLAAAGSSSQSVELAAPATAGTYYYGACVDTVTDESDTTNNCSQALEMTVGPAVSESADDCADDTSTTCRVRIAGSITRTIETAGDRDWVLLQGQIAAGGELLKGHRFRIWVEKRSVHVEGLGASIVEVLDSTGNQLTPRVVDDSGSGTATVTFVAEATALYYIEVSAFDPNATGAYGLLTMNTTSSTIQRLEIISDPGAASTYSVDDEIEVRVIFSSVVEVTGTPQLALDIGGVTRQASYTAGTGDQFLIFSYTVVPSDSDSDGIEIRANSVTTPSGSGIRAGGMDVPLQHDAVPADSRHQVNAVV